MHDSRRLLSCSSKRPPPSWRKNDLRIRYTIYDKKTRKLFVPCVPLFRRDLHKHGMAPHKKTKGCDCLENKKASAGAGVELLLPRTPFCFSPVPDHLARLAPMLRVLVAANEARRKQMHWTGQMASSARPCPLSSMRAAKSSPRRRLGAASTATACGGGGSAFCICREFRAPHHVVV